MIPMHAPLIALPSYPMKPGRVGTVGSTRRSRSPRCTWRRCSAPARRRRCSVRATSSTSEALTMLERFDGLVLPGGGDVDPGALRRAAAPSRPTASSRSATSSSSRSAAPRSSCQLPMLAICRGTQVLNVALGGTLTSTSPTSSPATASPASRAARTSTTIAIDAGSHVAAAMGAVRSSMLLSPPPGRRPPR